MRPALTAHRRLGGGIILLLKAAVWTFHSDFHGRRRLCHGVALLESLTDARAPKEAVFTGSSCRTTSGRACGASFAALLLTGPPLVTSDLPMKVAPSSITRRAAFKSPCKVQRDFSSQRSPTVILPCTLPYTVIDFVFTSPRMSAFSPIVKTPSELISPSTLPSIRSSF